MFENWQFGFIDLIDISLVAVVVYFVLRLIRGTRAVQMLMGLGVVVLVYTLARIFGLLTVEWIFGHFFSAFIVIMVVLFQHEIRRGLMRVAINPLGSAMHVSSSLVDPLVESAFALSHRGWGGLIVLERETGLKHLYESGVELEAPVRADVIQALFCPDAPMHDGAVIVRSGVIVAARVLLPLAQASALAGGFGTRHRAAVGLTEESDAMVVVISEENNDIRLAEEGRLSEAMDSHVLRETLMRRLIADQQAMPLLEGG